jgi:hypothetical protein
MLSTTPTHTQLSRSLPTQPPTHTPHQHSHRRPILPSHTSPHPPAATTTTTTPQPPPFHPVQKLRLKLDLKKVPPGTDPDCVACPLCDPWLREEAKYGA